LSAGQHLDARSSDALASSCGKYWHPLYAYIHRRGYPVEQASKFDPAALNILRRFPVGVPGTERRRRSRATSFHAHDGSMERGIFSYEAVLTPVFAVDIFVVIRYHITDSTDCHHYN
jgi:hypothetical protein